MTENEHPRPDLSRSFELCSALEYASILHQQAFDSQAQMMCKGYSKKGQLLVNVTFILLAIFKDCFRSFSTVIIAIQSYLLTKISLKGEDYVSCDSLLTNLHTYAL